MKVIWRLRATNVKTGKHQLVWATYNTKKMAQKIADAYNKTSDVVIWEVIRQEV